MNVIMIMRETGAEEMIKEFKEQIIENKLFITIQSDEEFDKMIEMQKDDE